MSNQGSDERPVVLRFEGMFPADLAGYEKHRTRKGGDLGHVDASRTHLNRRLIGSEDWAAEACAMIDEMKAENFADELESLTRRRRTSQIRKRMVEGPRDPWRATRRGPLREVILTANRKWFDEIEPDSDGRADLGARERAFEERAVAWLTDNFGDEPPAYRQHAKTSRWRAEQELKIAKAEVAVASRETVCAEAEADVVARETAVEGREAAVEADGLRLADERKLLTEERRKARASQEEADAVLAVADGLASGAIEIDAESDAPRLVPGPDATSAANAGLFARIKRSKLGRLRAASVFSAAFRKLRAKALKDAEATVSRDAAAIKRADEVIVEIAAQLPMADRARIAGVRKGLTAAIMALDPRRKTARRARGSGQKPDRGAEK